MTAPHAPWRGGRAFDTAHAAARRRPFDELEARVVQLALDTRDLTEGDRARVDAIRYGLSFARLTQLQNPDGLEVDLDGPLSAFANQMLELVRPRTLGARHVHGVLAAADEVVRRTRATRAALLGTLPVQRDALEAEVTTRQLVVASGGGGGAGYVYPGAYDVLDRAGLEPSLMVGTSIGALMSMFRARRRRFDLAALVAAARALAWGKVFKVLHGEHRYGIPATLHLHLHDALGALFQEEGGPHGPRYMTLAETEIPMFSVVTGITVDALAHGLDTYSHYMDGTVADGSTFQRARTALKTLEIVREFMGRRDALHEIVLGRTPGTAGFDVLDAAGFSAAIPAVIHYDVLRDDPHMTSVLDALYADYGISRLGEGGMVSNVPARIAWETAVSGWLGPRRNVFVLALDCFAPSALTRPAWLVFQQLVRSSNVNADRQFSDAYLAFPKTLSPLNLVPPLTDAMDAIRWGREAMQPLMPFVTEMMRPIRVMTERD